MRLRQRMFLMLTLSLVLGWLVPPAQAQSTGVIRGVVFLDRNGNLVQDADEPGYPGATLILAGAGASRQIITDAVGGFAVDVGTGTWQVTLLVPTGYTALDSVDRAVTISAEATLDATLTFALNAPVALDGAAPTPTLPPAILPQTGAALPPSVQWALVLFGGLAGGLVLLALGRWASRRA